MKQVVVGEESNIKTEIISQSLSTLRTKAEDVRNRLVELQSNFEHNRLLQWYKII